MWLIIYLIIHIICGCIIYYNWRKEAKASNEWSWKDFRQCFLLSLLIPILLLIIMGIIVLGDYIKNKFPKEPPKWL